MSPSRIRSLLIAQIRSWLWITKLSVPTCS